MVSWISWHGLGSVEFGEVLDYGIELIILCSQAVTEPLLSSSYEALVSLTCT